MEEYPSNTQRPKRVVPEKKAPEEKKVARVTTGGVKRQKKSLFRKAKESFVGDDSQSIAEYVFMDIMIPAAKNMIEDAVSQGMSRKLWGDAAPRIRGRHPIGGNGGWTPYNRPSSTLRQPPQQPQGMSRQARATHNFDEIVFETRVDADEVLGGLSSIIAEYEVATVRDFYDLVGEQATYTDEKYGWSTLDGAGIRPTRGGYLVVLPRPEQL